MNEKEVIKECLSIRGWSQSKLAEESGYKSQKNITGFLNRGENGLRMDVVVRLLNAMGYEVVVRDKMGSKQEWTIK